MRPEPVPLLVRLPQNVLGDVPEAELRVLADGAETVAGADFVGREAVAAGAAGAPLAVRWNVFGDF